MAGVHAKLRDNLEKIWILGRYGIVYPNYSETKEKRTHFRLFMSILKVFGSQVKEVIKQPKEEKKEKEERKEDG